MNDRVLPLDNDICKKLLMKYVFSLFCSFLSLILVAQNKSRSIDTACINSWSYVSSGALSKRGNYALYIIYNSPRNSSTLVVRSLADTWEYRKEGVELANFSANEKYVIFRVKDTLFVKTLGNGEAEVIPSIKSFEILPGVNGESLICFLNDSNSTLTIRDLISGKQSKIGHVSAYKYLKDNRTIVFAKDSLAGNGVFRCLYKASIDANEVACLWSENDTTAEIRVNSIASDNSHQALAFLTRNRDSAKVWYCRNWSAPKIVLSQVPVCDGKDRPNLVDINDHGFSTDGKFIFIDQETHLMAPVASSVPAVDVWSYKDVKLQSQQLYEIHHPSSARSVASLGISSGKLVQLNGAEEVAVLLDGRVDSIAYVSRISGDLTERTWNPRVKAENYLVAIQDGRRKAVNFDVVYASLRGKYLHGYDSGFNHYFTYELSTGKTFDLSNTFPENCRFYNDWDNLDLPRSDLEVAGWFENDSAILMYDKYDIWSVDPHGKRPALCLTNGYGKAHQLILRLISIGDSKQPITDSGSYILSVVDDASKETGFIKWTFNRKHCSFAQLAIGPFNYHLSAATTSGGWATLSDTGYILVQRESSSESPNYFVTRDLKNFLQLSHTNPENDYNWLKSNIIHWKSLAGTNLSGFIYKPQDFDERKKYPVIFNYYGRMTQRGYEFIQPGLTSDNLNIPWFVSRGYVVFTPDIRYRIGFPGESALDAIVSGAKALCRQKWVDSTRLAIQGHSWGGYETNYIVTHSKLFAAAVAGSSFADFVSDNVSTLENGSTKHWFYETGICRMGASIWEKKALYLQNSPVLFADRVSTPLLMMANKADPVVGFNQGLEFFLALRRMGKRVWLLQYDNQGHAPSNEAALDYTLRINQFFDHYCKGLPAPVWMVEGVPAQKKAMFGGMESDTTGSRP